MTDEQLEEQTQAICASLGPVHGRLLTDGYEASAEAVMDAGVLLQSLACRVLAAEKLAREVQNYTYGNAPLHSLVSSLTSYREACK